MSPPRVENLLNIAEILMKLIKVMQNRCTQNGKLSRMVKIGCSVWPNLLASFPPAIWIPLLESILLKAPRFAIPGFYPPPLLFTALQALNLFEPLFTVAKGLRTHFHLVHHREEQSGELAIGFAGVIESTATLDAATGPAEDDHWKLIVIVESAGHHT